MLNRIQFHKGRIGPSTLMLHSNKAHLHLSDVVPWQTVLPWPLIVGRDYRVL